MYPHSLIYPDPIGIDMYISVKKKDGSLLYFSKRNSSKNEAANAQLVRTCGGSGSMTMELSSIRTSDVVYGYNKGKGITLDGDVDDGALNPTRQYLIKVWLSSPQIDYLPQPLTIPFFLRSSRISDSS